MRVTPGLVYHGGSSGTERLIGQTLKWVPEDLREFALDRCDFVSVGRASYALRLPARAARDRYRPRRRGVWLVRHIRVFPDYAQEPSRACLVHPGLAEGEAAPRPGRDAGERA
jgi:hypothetical protein